MRVFVANEQSFPVDLAELRGLAELVLREEGYPDDTELTLLFVDEAEITGYNRRFLHREGPTDVLAFPVEILIPGIVPERDHNGPPLVVGDVIIAPTYVARQAEREGVAFEDEMALMVTHGILHLLGYDHRQGDEAEMMERRERELMAMVGRDRP
ncbi:MAG: rRNA maturation RNase YbeY [Acidimicrobiia bacterium]